MSEVTMQNPHSEYELVEKPTIDLLNEMGWETRDCFDEFEQGSSFLGRENRGEVVLTARLRPALERLNPNASPALINEAIDQLSRPRFTLPAEANLEIYNLLKDGVKVPDPDDESETVVVLKVIDWENPENNDFFLASQFWITGEVYKRRPDAIGFINGLPLVLMEFKRIDENLEAAFQGNLRDYKNTIPRLFWYNALIILSNGSESKFGSLTALWEHFAEWKRIEREDESGEVSLETILRGICDRRRLLDIIENFTLFMDTSDGLIKLIGKNHQYLGVNNTIKALQGRASNQRKLGVFWHTQGSGKSISMIFFAQKVLRKIPGSWRFVIVTDRKELDDQIYKNFANSRGVVTQSDVHARDIQDLRQLLSADHRYVFTLIQKFQTNDGEEHPVLSDQSNIIVITDESHRSQYDTLALNMRTALPNAAFIAFTGTPLLDGEEQTTKVFGDYVSKYNFKQSIVDGATVPLFYENRVPTVQLDNDDLNEDLKQISDAASFDEAQEQRIEQEFVREYHVITRDERLEKIAKDIVKHFVDRGYRGKAMVISIDKATAVKMYDKVQKHRQCYVEDLEARLQNAGAEEREKLQAKIRYLEETDMAVVVSQSQNEEEDLSAKGVNIIPHRIRMNDEDLDTKFKDSTDPLRIVFVCAMWMTGFDVPSCSTIYLDKPQRNHTLMQTIARANRVFGDKVSGLIVDYIGIFRNLQQALANYAEGTDAEGRNPIRDKSELVETLREAISEIKIFCANLDIDLNQIDPVNTDPFEQIGQIKDATNKILIKDKTKQDYLQRVGNISKLYKAILPDAAANEFIAIYSFINTVGRKIKSLNPSADISDVSEAIEDILDESIVPTRYTIDDDSETQPIYDLSEIDFDQLQEIYRTGHKNIEIERLRNTISSTLSRMIQRNRSRMDYQERFEQIIAAYNEGAITQEIWFEQLVTFARKLNEEDQRTIVERLSEEELAVFDLLTRPEMDLTEGERDEVKTISKSLLTTLKQEKLVLDWRKRQQSCGAVREAIDSILEDLPLPHYTDDIYDQKSEMVYQHIYDCYYGAGNSIYSTAA